MNGPESRTPAWWAGSSSRLTSAPFVMTSFTGPVSTSRGGIVRAMRSATPGMSCSSVVSKAMAAWRGLAGAWPSARQPGYPVRSWKNRPFSRDW